MSANTETTGADRTKCKAPAWCDFDDNDEGDPRLRVYVGARDGIYGVVSTDGRRYCTPACRDARLPHIVAPAAHAERRKVEVGQRRKNHRDTFTVYAIEGDRAIVCQTGQVDPVNDYVHKGGTDCCWESVSVLEDCDLLADATPEPLTAKDVFGEIPPGSKLTNDTPVKVASSPPAQEAPKAAPVLEWSFTDDENRVHRFATGNERDAASRAYWSWMAEQTGKSYAGPERLPKPQLAADWVEDCIGDVR